MITSIKYKKINDFIENINKQFIINSKLFKDIESLSEDLKKSFIDQDLPLINYY